MTYDISVTKIDEENNIFLIEVVKRDASGNIVSTASTRANSKEAVDNIVKRLKAGLVKYKSKKKEESDLKTLLKSKLVTV